MQEQLRMITVHNAELIAAILTAGMLPSVPLLDRPEDARPEDAKRIVSAVGHAISLYAAVLEGLRSV